MLGDLEVKGASDSEYDYSIHKSGVFVQKKGEQNWNCYECDSQIKAKYLQIPDWAEHGWGKFGGGETVTKQIPYCATCRPEITHADLF